MNTGRVLSIQSHVVYGYVGNKSATFPLQVLGFDVDPINSVQFSNHTGYGVLKGQVLNATDLQELYSGLKDNELLKYSHVLTGYIGSTTFLSQVHDLVIDLKQANPNMLYVCDPVMGDNGKLYVPQELLPIYRKSIIPLAEIITPNQFEAELLTEIKITDLDTAKQAIAKLHEMGAKTVVLSSTDLGTGDVLVTLGSQGGSSELIRVVQPRIDANFTGSGDLFAALLLAWLHNHPGNLGLALEKTISTMQHVLKRTVAYAQERPYAGAKKEKMASMELRLIQSKADIENPTISVKVEKVL